MTTWPVQSSSLSSCSTVTPLTRRQPTYLILIRSYGYGSVYSYSLSISISLSSSKSYEDFDEWVDIAY